MVFAALLGRGSGLDSPRTRSCADSAEIRQDSGLDGSRKGSAWGQSDLGSTPVLESGQTERGYGNLSDSKAALTPYRPTALSTSSVGSISPSRSPERVSFPGFEILGSIIHAVAGVALPLIATTALSSSIASACHDKKELSVQLLTVYEYSVVAAFTTTFFRALTQGWGKNCTQVCRQKSDLLMTSMKKIGEIEGVIGNTVIGPIAVVYFIVKSMGSDPSTANDTTV